MKPIKFRGKSLKTKKWKYGYFLPFADERSNSACIAEPVEGEKFNGCAVDPETVGQFTGLYDNKGNEVWEGDIVRYRLTDERYKKNPRFKNLLIHYEDSSARFMAGDIYWKTLRREKVEVIGNIHDNPELLKEDTD